MFMTSMPPARRFAAHWSETMRVFAGVATMVLLIAIAGFLWMAAAR
jgi:hypothetical protein